MKHKMMHHMLEPEYGHKEGHRPKHEKPVHHKKDPKKKNAPHKKEHDKMKKVMAEYKHDELHSGSKKGPKVHSRKQAIAIGLSEARKAGAHIPKKKK